MILQGGKKISEGYKGITMDVYNNDENDEESNLYDHMKVYNIIWIK